MAQERKSAEISDLHNLCFVIQQVDDQLNSARAPRDRAIIISSIMSMIVNLNQACMIEKATQSGDPELVQITEAAMSKISGLLKELNVYVHNVASTELPNAFAFGTAARG